MSDAQKLIADVLFTAIEDQAWTWRESTVEEAVVDGTLDLTVIAAEIDGALGGLHRITQSEYPERWEAGEKICDAGRLASRWVSGWEFVGAPQT